MCKTRKALRLSGLHFTPERVSIEGTQDGGLALPVIF